MIAATATKAVEPIRRPISPTWETTEICLVAFLQCLGHRVARVDRSGSRATFVMENSQEMQDDILCWVNNEEIPIRVRDFLNNFRNLKGMVG